MSDSKTPQSEIQNLLNSISSVEKTEENPWQGDCADREKFADKFTTMIENIGAKSPAVILLSGKWGTGKSYFLKSLQLKLKSEKYRAIYFDAFAEGNNAEALGNFFGVPGSKVYGDLERGFSTYRVYELVKG